MGKDNFGKIIHSFHFVANVLLKPMNVYFVTGKNPAQSFLWCLIIKKKKTRRHYRLCDPFHNRTVRAALVQLSPALLSRKHLDKK